MAFFAKVTNFRTQRPCPSGGGGGGLFNGNINAMAVNIPKLGDAKVYGYKYDQLNRLVAMDAYNGLDNITNVFTPVSISDYKERVSYDANGNIQSYQRNGNAARLNMDNLTYTYKPNTNQLDKVTDAAPDAALGEYDKYNDIKQGQQNGNYQYDEIGNLTSDVSEGISNITWTVYGKINTITKANGTNIAYTYSASGNRISKNVNGKETWYARDASGNVMSIYRKDAAINNGDLTQTELSIFGSSRLGILNLKNNVEHPDLNTGRIITFTTGNKFFELGNHLQNVLATVSDKKIQHSTDGTTVDYFTADVVSAQDYYPAGMLMAGRKYSIANNSYRYGFNGKEKSNEISGEGNAYNFDARMYDPRVARWYSTDTKEKPHLSPYNFVQNNFPNKIDPDGKDDIHFHFITHVYIETYGIGVNKRSFTRLVNTAEIEIIKTNGPDRFFNHRTFISSMGMTDKVKEFHPFVESSRSGLTTTPMPFSAGLLKRDDRDIHTLAKYYDASPVFRKYLDARMKNGGNDFYTSGNWNNYKNKFFPERANFNFWGKVSSGAEISADVLLLARGGLALFEKNSVTLYRNFGPNEMNSLLKNDMKFSLKEGGSSGKDFWLSREGLNTWKQTNFSKPFNVEIKVGANFYKNLPNEAFFTDNLPGGAFKAINVENLKALNSSIKDIKFIK